VFHGVAGGKESLPGPGDQSGINLPVNQTTPDDGGGRKPVSWLTNKAAKSLRRPSHFHWGRNLAAIGPLRSTVGSRS
jgi:hypothetical protein